MVMIPIFPEFKPIEIADRKVLDDCFREHPPLVSEFTFTNLFGWRMVHNYRISKYKDGFLILKEVKTKLSFLQPIATGNPVEAVQACFEYLKGKTGLPQVERVEENFIAAGAWDNSQFIVSEDRDNFDYLYDTKELGELAGEKFHDKKNLVNQFRKKYPYQYQNLTPELIPECLQFEHEWCEDRDCDETEGLRHEKYAVLEMLNNFPLLGSKGGIIRVAEKIAALTLGERLNKDTMVIHVEKAQSGITGIYQAINCEFLKNQAHGFRFVNREQDLGVKGLRKAKMSYNPVRLIKKYRITPPHLHPLP
ncbi:MAG: phosphatidylglycerol lysyltransferase domain-containing protein [Candidatus Omnitrophica bacterium]|nr:phosphatidylglycerol lysyltransferase domain-containing protein [Candidatus Omnitrophota bacterium]